MKKKIKKAYPTAAAGETFLSTFFLVFAALQPLPHFFTENLITYERD
jgi:hypothetical protein